MKKIKKRFLLSIIFLFFLSFSIPAFASTYCARPSAQGSGNGSDWSNAVALSTVAGSSSYRGHTVYFSGESYGSMTFTAGTSGSNYITLKKATALDHGTSTGWNSSWGTNKATFSHWGIRSSYWIFDGQEGGGYGSWNTGHGIKISTGGGKIIYIGENTTTASYISISHVEIQGVWDGAGSGNDGIYAYTGDTDLTISYVYIHDTGRTAMLFHNSDNVIVEQSHFYHNESHADEHSELIAMQGGDNHVFKNNLFKDGAGTGPSVVYKKNLSWMISDNVQFYGNVVNGGTLGNGAVCDTSGKGGATSNLKIFNNVFMNISGNGNGAIVFSKGGSNQYAYNNIFLNSLATGFVHNIGTKGYNWYYNVDGRDAEIAAAETGGVVGSGNPFTDSGNDDYTLTSAISGYNLTSRWPTINTIDAAGYTRGEWNRGAYEHESGVIYHSTISSPLNLRIIP